jgi:acid phosphatase class B
MCTVSFDWDKTLWDEDNQAFISETVALLREHLAKGDRVIITTARMKGEIGEVHRLLALLQVSEIPVFSAPGGFVWGDKQQLTKSQVLLREEAVIHFDDFPDMEDLNLAKKAGVDIKLPPATNAIVARMY